jgi:hypothetical protein
MARTFSLINAVNSKQQIQINVAITILTALTTFVSVHSYLQARKSKATDDRIQALDLEIKTLTLQKLKNGQ